MVDENQVEGGIRQTAGKVKGAVGNLTGDTKSQAEGWVDDTAGKAQRAYGSAKDTVRDAANQVSGGSGDYASSLLDQVEEYGDYLAEQVDQRPITAVLIAAGVGFLFALMMKPSPKVVYRRR
jgi:uncharacterized protein YjbJ (UPF0337 family)